MLQILFNVALAAGGVGQTTSPVTPDQMAALRQTFDARLLAEPSLVNTELESIAWRCDAWPTYGYGNWYWIAYDLNLAAYQALSLCQAASYTTCYYWCNSTYVYP